MSENVNDIEQVDEAPAQASGQANDAALESLQRENDKMRAKLDELLGEAKRAKEAKRKAELEAAQAAEAKARKDGDFEQLLKSSETEREALRAELEGLRGEVKRKAVDAEAMRLATTLTSDTAKAELLAEKFAQRLALSEDGFRVLDEAGQLTVSPVDELTKQLQERFAFLVDGSRASGGGAIGANGSAAQRSTKVWSDYNGAELSQIRQTDAAEYERLKNTR